ncbi:MAG: membrane dipeptidase [Acidobacteria bacterium]|nr:MAG: membrane dipeptidase [Acidobacteriota bacterium]
MPRPRSIVPLFTFIAAVSVGAQPPTVSARAARVHKQAIVLDTHIDTTQFLLRDNWDFFARHDPPIRGAAASTRSNDGNSHVDFPRMRDGGLDAAFFSIYMPGTVTGPEAVRRSLLMIDAVHRLAERHPNEVALATTAAEVRAAAKAGKVAALMGMEGGHMIDDNLSVLRGYARLGVRYLTLTHSVNTNWADSSGDKPAHDGLTDFGKDVVRELNRLGVMVDISHVADKTFWDALEISRAPLVASHSSCRAISGHPRNMTDDMIKALAAKGGVIQINYSTSFLSNELYEATQKNVPPAERPSVSWEKIVEHIDHAVKLAGPTHVGLGSDFDGTTVPVGMDDVTRLPKITEALLAKGYSEQDVTNILGGNLLRLMERVEQVARDSRAGMAGEAGRAGPATLPGPFLIIPGLARQNLYPTPNVTLCALSGVSAEIREKR